jgi:hypothetical protein
MRLVWMQIVILTCGTAIAALIAFAPRAYEKQCAKPRDRIDAMACEEVQRR